MKEMEALKKEQEEKNKSHLEDLSKIHDKIMKLVSFIPEYCNGTIYLFNFNAFFQDETHTETMKKLLEERNVERKEAQMEIISANRFLLISLVIYVVVFQTVSRSDLQYDQVSIRDYGYYYGHSQQCRRKGST